MGGTKTKKEKREGEKRRGRGREKPGQGSVTGLPPRLAGAGAGRRVESMADAAEGSVEDMTGGAVLQCCQRVGSALQVKGMGG
ncbi:hypothetical protein V6Z11_A08G217000 [Gossypium hirsutum]